MEEMYNKLIDSNLTPNQLYILWAKIEKIGTPLVNESLEERLLKNKGFLDSHGNITTKGLNIIKEVEGYFKKRKKKTDNAIMGDDFEENIIKYNNLFPKERLNSGKNARSAINNIKPGFRWFFENNNFTWDEIFEATRAYVSSQENEGKKFMTCSQYFIRKQQVDKSWVSLLADWCQSVRDGLDDPPTNHFSENVF